MSGPYIRRKEKGFCIEERVNGKTKFIMTVPPADELITILRQYKDNKKPSKSPVGLGAETSQRFAQDLLNEEQKPDGQSNNNGMIDKEILKRAQSAADDLLKDVVPKKKASLSLD